MQNRVHAQRELRIERNETKCKTKKLTNDTYYRENKIQKRGRWERLAQNNEGTTEVISNSLV